MNDKRMKKNIDRLCFAVKHSSDVDLLLCKYAVDLEYDKRNVDGYLDNIMAEIKSAVDEISKDK